MSSVGTTRDYDVIEFLVEFEVNIPDGTPESEIRHRENAEAVAAAKLVDEGHLVRLWKPHVATGETKILGLYRAESQTELDALLGALPLYEWMRVTVTPLGQHPNDPEATVATGCPSTAATPQPSLSHTDHSSHQQESPMSTRFPDPRLTKIYRLEATLGQALDVGDIAPGRRRIVPLTGGTFTGPELNGKLLPGVSADWQIVLSDGTALGDIRYTLQTDAGDLLYVQSRGVRHGSAEVLARLGRGENVDASEYTFRTSTQIETAAADLDWLNKGIFIGVAGRQPGGVIYETYLVG
jgi:muconolactone delta-isomerase